MRKLVLPCLVLLAGCEDSLPTSVTSIATGRRAALHLAPTRIVWESGRDGNAEIYSADGDGGGVMRLTYNAAADMMPALSPDGRRIAFSSGRSGSADIYVMNSDGKNVRQITHGSPPDFNPAWSPDGSELAFVRAELGEWRIYLVRLDGTDERRLAGDVHFRAGLDWSPDGVLLAYHKESGGQYDVFTLDVATAAEQQLTMNPALDAQPSWSPDGARIAFASDRGSRWDIHTMDAAGGTVARVTDDDVLDAAPDWSSDGSALVFERYPDAAVNSADLYRIARDGSGLAAVITGASDDRGPSWGPAAEPPSNLGITGARVTLSYEDRDTRTRVPASATGASYWIEGALTSEVRHSEVRHLGRVVDEATVFGLAAATYNVLLGYGEPTFTSARSGSLHAPLSPPQPVRIDVKQDRTTTVDVALEEFMGIVRGVMTLNKDEPGDGFWLCTYRPGVRAALDLLWCTPLAANGTFAQLLPVGHGAGRICATSALLNEGCPPFDASPTRTRRAGETLASFTYRLTPGHTENLPPIDVTTTALELRLVYSAEGPEGAIPPSATGAAHWIEGVWDSQTPVSLGRIEDEAAVYAIAPGGYELQLAFGAPPGTGSPPTPSLLDRDVIVQIGANGRKRVVVELARTMGIVDGSVTLNRGPVDEGLVLCTYVAGRVPRLLWCNPLDGSGTFRQLLPAGPGVGRVCDAAMVTQTGCPAVTAAMDRRARIASLAIFQYDVSAGRTKTIDPIKISATALELSFTYTDRRSHMTVPLSRTNARHVLEGQLTSRSVTTIQLGPLDDEEVHFGLAAAMYAVEVYYGPTPAHPTQQTQPLDLGIQSTINVSPRGRTTVATADLGNVLGIVSGAVTLNQAPPGDGFTVCAYTDGGRISRVLICTPLAADGGFRLLLPEVSGVGRVCLTSTLTATSECPEAASSRSSRSTGTIATFKFEVRTGEERTAQVIPAP